MGAVLVASAATMWGFWPVVLRDSGLSGLESCFVVFVAMSLPAPWLLVRGGPRLLAAFCAGTRRLAGWPAPATWALIVIGLADVGSVGFYFAALPRGPVAVAVLTHYLAPVLVAVAAPFATREPRSVPALVATPLAVLGLGMLVWRQDAALPLVTAAMGAASAGFYATLVLAAKTAGRRFSPVAITCLHTPISALVMLALFGGEVVPATLHVGVWRVAAAGLAFGVGGSVLFYSGLRWVAAPVAGALTYLEPLVGSLAAVVLFGEHLGSLGACGAVLVLGSGVGVALASSASSASSPSAPMTTSPPVAARGSPLAVPELTRSEERRCDRVTSSSGSATGSRDRRARRR